MTSPTQTVVGKDIPNPLIAEDLLKILRDLIPPFLLKSSTDSRPWNGRTTKGCIHFLNKMNHRSELSCLKLTPLTVKSTVKSLADFANIPSRSNSTCHSLQ